MIRVICSSCKSKLNAKDELAGQTRKCPKCGTPVQIVRPEPRAEPSPDEMIGLDEPIPDQHVHGASDKSLDVLDVSDRLDRTSHYLICDKSKLVASWENNGKGWMLRTGAGAIGAARNYQLLPAQGDFTLVQLKLAETGSGVKLSGITSYQLAKRWALTKLERGDNQILSSVTAYGSLNRDQKGAIRQAIKDQFMFDVWKDARDVLDYLRNTDYHSPGTG